MIIEHDGEDIRFEFAHDEFVGMSTGSMWLTYDQADKLLHQLAHALVDIDVLKREKAGQGAAL